MHLTLVHGKDHDLPREPLFTRGGGELLSIEISPLILPVFRLDLVQRLLESGSVGVRPGKLQAVSLTSQLTRGLLVTPPRFD